MTDEHRRFLLAILDDPVAAKMYADWLDEQQLKGAKQWRTSRQPKTLAFRELAKAAGNTRSRWFVLVSDKYQSRTWESWRVASGFAHHVRCKYGVPATLVSVTRPHHPGTFALSIGPDAWLGSREQFSVRPPRGIVL